jgi:hypothetical protein
LSAPHCPSPISTLKAPLLPDPDSLSVALSKLSLGRFRVDPHLEKLPDRFDPTQNAVVYESERRIALPQSGTVLSGVGSASRDLSTSALQASHGETLGLVHGSRDPHSHCRTLTPTFKNPLFHHHFQDYVEDIC